GRPHGAAPSGILRKADPGTETQEGGGREAPPEAQLPRQRATALTPATTLTERITEDMKAAMRAGEKERLGTIRMLQAAIKQREVDERITLDDSQVRAVLEKMVKQRKESITQFTAGGRADLVAKETAELELLQAY